MEMTNDEFCALIQSRDPNLANGFYDNLKQLPNNPSDIQFANKSYLDQKISLDAQKRHQSSAFRNMPQREFEYLRQYHMAQLFTAYKNEYDGTANRNSKWLGSPTTTNENDIRRVIGDKPGYIDYQGPMVLDHETILAVCHLASLRGYGNRHSDNEWVNDMNFGGLSKVVDEMISTKNILLENGRLEGDRYSLITGSTIYHETDIAKRAIENKVGNIVFDKTHHAEAAHDFVHRKTNAFSKTASKFKQFFEKINDPDAYNKKMQQLGNQQFELDTNEGR